MWLDPRAASHRAAFHATADSLRVLHLYDANTLATATYMAPPIAVFAYNRPAHLSQTLAALARNHGAIGHDVVAFSDGPRSPADLTLVQRVREELASWRGKGAFRSFSVVERAENHGLARSIIQGVTSLCDSHGQAIVLEDDLVTSPFFLQYMRDGLAMYADSESVAALHGYAFPMSTALPETYFLAGADCWGWATWKRAWSRFEADGNRLLAAIQAKGLRFRFDIDGSYPYTRMLRHQTIGRNNSWAIRWRASTYLAGMVSLHPSRSLVANIGFDGSGTHCHASRAFTTELSDTPISISFQPTVESSLARRALVRYFRSIAGPRGQLRCALANVQERLRGTLLGNDVPGPHGP